LKESKRISKDSSEERQRHYTAPPVGVVFHSLESLLRRDQEGAREILTGICAGGQSFFETTLQVNGRFLQGKVGENIHLPFDW